MTIKDRIKARRDEMYARPERPPVFRSFAFGESRPPDVTITAVIECKPGGLTVEIDGVVQQITGVMWQKIQHHAIRMEIHDPQEYVGVRLTPEKGHDGRWRYEVKP